MNLLDALSRFYYDLSLGELRRMHRNTPYPNISYNSMLYLDLISNREQCTVSQLAELLHISKPAVTIKVGELIRQGLVEKKRSDTDRRVYYLSTSPAVAADYREFHASFSRAADALEHSYSQKDIETFQGMLALLREKFLEEPG